MQQKNEYIWYFSFFVFLLFANYAYTMGLIIAVSHGSSGLYWMIFGIVIMAIIVIASFIFCKKPYINAISSIGCFLFVVWNLTRYSFLDRMEKTQQETSALGSSDSIIVGDISTLRLLHTIITIIFISIAVIEGVFSIYLHKRFGKEKKEKIKDKKFKMEELNIEEDKPSITVELMRFKYCPRCLYQTKVENEEEKCPKCNVELKFPELTPN